MGTHLYDSFHSFERILEGNQELRKEVLTMFGGHGEFNGCKSVMKTDIHTFDQVSFHLIQISAQVTSIKY